MAEMGGGCSALRGGQRSSPSWPRPVSPRLLRVHVRAGDGSRGWRAHAPFDAAPRPAALSEPPRDLLDQLRPGGRMASPAGRGRIVQQLSGDRGRARRGGGGNRGGAEAGARGKWGGAVGRFPREASRPAGVNDGKAPPPFPRVFGTSPRGKKTGMGDRGCREACGETAGPDPGGRAPLPPPLRHQHRILCHQDRSAGDRACSAVRGSRGDGARQATIRSAHCSRFLSSIRSVRHAEVAVVIPDLAGQHLHPVRGAFEGVWWCARCHRRSSTASPRISVQFCRMTTSSSDSVTRLSSHSRIGGGCVDTRSSGREDVLRGGLAEHEASEQAVRGEAVGAVKAALGAFAGGVEALKVGASGQGRSATPPQV